MNKVTRILCDVVGKILGEEDCAICQQSLWHSCSMEITKHYDLPPHDTLPNENQIWKITGKYTVCDGCSKDAHLSDKIDRQFHAAVGDYFNGDIKITNTREGGK